MAKDFNTILSEAQQIKNEIIEGANTALRTGTCLEDIVQRAESDEGLAAKKARTITAGNGLTGGGSLATDMELTVGNTDDSIVVGADGIKVDTQDSLTSTSITKPLSAAKGKALQDTKANKTVTIEAGNGLTGGGDLSGNRTLNIESATDGITPNADNIQLNTIDNVTSTSATKPLSANQGKVLNEKIVQVETDLNEKLDKDITGTLGENLITNETLFTDGKFVYTANNSLGNSGTLTYCSVPVVEGKTYRFTCYQDLVNYGYICRVLSSLGNYVVEQGSTPFFNHIISLGNRIIEITIPDGGVTLQINTLITQKATAFVKQLYSENDKISLNWLEVTDENLEDSIKEKINNPQITNVIANQINGDFTIISSDILMGYTYTAGGYKKQISNTQTQTVAHATIHSAIIYGVEGDVFLVSNTQLVDPAGPLANSYYVFGKNDTVPAILISEIPNYVTLYDAVNKIYKVVMPKDCTIFYLAVSDAYRPTSFIKKCVTKKPLDWLEVESKNIPLAVTDEISTSVKNTIESQQVSEEANYHLWDCINKPIIFSGKSLIAFGNSITSGVSSPGLVTLGTTKYISLFCDHVGAILTNKAISGSVITDSGNQYDICKRVIQYATSDYDIVWIAGGTNDYNLNMPIGTYASTDQTTLYGALRAICEHLKTNCPNAVVIFVTPIPYTSVARRTKTEIQKLDTVRSAIYDVATLYGYNVVDGKNLGMPKTSGNWNNAMVDDSDGCHPTELGHSLYAKLLAGKLL